MPETATTLILSIFPLIIVSFIRSMVVEDGSYIIFHHIYGTRVTIELLHMVILFFTFPKMFIDEIIVNPNRFWNFLK